MQYDTNRHHFHEPPDPLMECSWCDGYQEVFVASVVDRDGKHQSLIGIVDIPVGCPHCNGTGEEPAQEPDPDRQRDEMMERDHD